MPNRLVKIEVEVDFLLLVIIGRSYLGLVIGLTDVAKFDVELIGEVQIRILDLSRGPHLVPRIIDLVVDPLGALNFRAVFLDATRAVPSHRVFLLEGAVGNALSFVVEEHVAANQAPVVLVVSRL